jgi:hypothetical protein
VALGATLLVASTARAQVEAIRIAYHAAPGCPDEVRFVDDVMGRTDRARRASDAERGRTFDVVLTGEGAKSRGVLRITDAGGRLTKREVVGQSCSDVAGALALVAALAIDPEARTRSDSSARPSAETSSAQPALAPPPEVGASSDNAPDRENFIAIVPDRLPSPPRSRLRFSVGAMGEASAGFVPGTAAGGGFFVDVERVETLPLVVSFRLTLSATDADASFAPSVAAHLTWLVARIEACPLRLSIADPLTISLCASMEAGALRSNGEGLASVGSQTDPWLAPGASARVAWPIPGGEGSWVEGSAGLSVPLERYSFYYEQGGTLDRRDVATVAAVGSLLAVGAGYRFP